MISVQVNWCNHSSKGDSNENNKYDVVEVVVILLVFKWTDAITAASAILMKITNMMLYKKLLYN